MTQLGCPEDDAPLPRFGNVINVILDIPPVIMQNLEVAEGNSDTLANSHIVLISVEGLMANAGGVVGGVLSIRLEMGEGERWGSKLGYRDSTILNNELRVVWRVDNANPQALLLGDDARREHHIWFLGQTEGGDAVVVSEFEGTSIVCFLASHGLRADGHEGQDGDCDHGIHVDCFGGGSMRSR